jgi:hypothetical protein
MPDPKVPIAVEQLGLVFGPSMSVHVSECKHGGFLVIVDGAVHSAWTHGWEVREALGHVMADKYGKAFTPPVEARDVTPGGPAVRPPVGDAARDMARRFAPDKQQPAGNGPSPTLSERTRSTVSLALMVLLGCAQAVMGA